jgi:hypothetical protein
MSVPRPARSVVAVIAIAGAGLAAIAAGLDQRQQPTWSLAVFLLRIYVIHGIFIHGTTGRRHP